jgi:hypothetical protein
VQSASPGTAQPTGGQPTPAGTGSTSGLNAGNNAAGSSGFNQPTSPSAGIPTLVPGASANGSVTGQSGNLVFNGPGVTSFSRLPFPTLPTGAILGTPPTTTFGVPGSPPSGVLTFQGPSAVGSALGLLPGGLGPVVASPNYQTGAPQYFDPNTHRLLFVVGGPNPRVPEDYREGFEDGAVIPGPNAPRLSFLEDGAPPAYDAREMPRPAAMLSPLAANLPLLSETYFCEGAETATSAVTETLGLSAVGLVASESAPLVNADQSEAREKAKAETGFLAALVGLGFLGGPSWRKEERSRPLWRRWRPALLAFSRGR